MTIGRFASAGVYRARHAGRAQRSARMEVDYYQNSSALRLFHGGYGVKSMKPSPRTHATALRSVASPHCKQPCLRPAMVTRKKHLEDY